MFSLLSHVQLVDSFFLIVRQIFLFKLKLSEVFIDEYCFYHGRAKPRVDTLLKYFFLNLDVDI